MLTVVAPNADFLFLQNLNFKFSTSEINKTRHRLHSISENYASFFGQSHEIRSNQDDDDATTRYLYGRVVISFAIKRANTNNHWDYLLDAK